MSISLQLEFGLVWPCFNSLQKINIPVYNIFKIILKNAEILKCSMGLIFHYLDITTSMTGFILLVMYLAMDSFTSTWQGRIFTQYQVTPMQMVFGNSLLSSLFTSVSLYQSDSFKKTYAFMKEVFFVLLLILLQYIK